MFVRSHLIFLLLPQSFSPAKSIVEFIEDTTPVVADRILLVLGADGKALRKSTKLLLRLLASSSPDLKDAPSEEEAEEFLRRHCAIEVHRGVFPSDCSTADAEAAVMAVRGAGQGAAIVLIEPLPPAVELAVLLPLAPRALWMLVRPPPLGASASTLPVPVLAQIAHTAAQKNWEPREWIEPVIAPLKFSRLFDLASDLVHADQLVYHRLGLVVCVLSFPSQRRIMKC